ncbi:1,6-anhydro-N-acetylmuramyl-L-alanine amidase AmpD [Propionivibrio dicarboxylicus]
MTLGPDGWLIEARRVPSPNFDTRPIDMAISLLVVHAISLPPGVFSGDCVERLFLNSLDTSAHPYFVGLKGLRVSSHFFIRRDGELVQFVSCCDRAWHAGVSAWQGRSRCNDFSIGIELEGGDDDVFEEAQYRRLSSLVACLSHRYPIAAVAGHADISPGRKTDPGTRFDWTRLPAMLVAERNRITRFFMQGTK